MSAGQVRDSMLSRLVRQSGLYALGTVAVKCSGFLLTPFYLNPAYLSVEGYGYFALLNVTAQLGIYVVGLGLGFGLLKFMSDPVHEREHAALPFTALTASAGIALVALLMLWLLAAPLAHVMLDDASQYVLIHLLGLYVIFKVIAGIPLMVMRIQERVALYSFAAVAEVGVLMGAVYYFLVVRQQGLAGIMNAYVLSAGISMVVLVSSMLARVQWIFRKSLLAPLIRYGVPLAMAGLAGWVLYAGDRYLLKWLSTTEVVALYEWAARLGGVIYMLLVQSLELAFSVIGLKSIGKGERDVHRRTFRHYVIWTGWAVLGLSLLALDLTKLFVEHLGASRHYLEADSLILPLALGFMSYGIYYIVNNGHYGAGRTRVIGFNVLLAALLNVLLNLALIPQLGGMGAALASFVAYTVLALLSAWLAEQQIHVGYPWRVFVVVVLTVMGLYGAAQLTVSWPVVLRLPVRLGMILAYLPLLVLFRLYAPEEVRRGLGYFQRQWHKLKQ